MVDCQSRGIEFESCVPVPSKFRQSIVSDLRGILVNGFKQHKFWLLTQMAARARQCTRTHASLVRRTRNPSTKATILATGVQVCIQEMDWKTTRAQSTVHSLALDARSSTCVGRYRIITDLSGHNALSRKSTIRLHSNFTPAIDNFFAIYVSNKSYAQAI